MTRFRTLSCGHTTLVVHDYTDAYRWQIRCGDCGHEEEWTQREWRLALVPPPASLIEVTEITEDDDALLQTLN